MTYATRPSGTAASAALSLLLVLVAGCGDRPASDAAPEAAGSPEPEAAPAPVPAPDEVDTEAAEVTIVSPADGAVLEGPVVEVILEARGVRIVPAGDMTPGTGHHHLYLDADLGDPSVPVPTEPGRIVHLGDGSSEYTFEDVPPGEHRLITVVADGTHVPLQPWVVDTVTFTVEAGR